MSLDDALCICIVATVVREAAKRVSSSSSSIWDISKTPGLNTKCIILLLPFLLMERLKLFSSGIQSLNAQDLLAADNRTRINLLYNINISININITSDKG